VDVDVVTHIHTEEYVFVFIYVNRNTELYVYTLPAIIPAASHWEGFVFVLCVCVHICE